MSSLRKKLTVFTTCKPFVGENGVMQRNAMATWQALDCPAILVGIEAGVDEQARKLGATNLRENAYHDSGMPYVNDVFAKAQQAIETPFCCYINSDILLPAHTVNAVQLLLTSTDVPDAFLLTSRRRNIPLCGELPESELARNEHLSSLDNQYGSWDSSTAVDFFLFPTGMFVDLPPFLFGRMQWDNWLLWKASDLGARVIDASLDMHLLHPIHGYAADGTNWLIRAHSDDAAANRDLAGGNSLTIDGALSDVLEDGTVKPAGSTELAKIKAACQPDPRKELGSGLVNLVQNFDHLSPQEIVDFCRTLLWRAGYFFPTLLETNPSPEDLKHLQNKLDRGTSEHDKALLLQGMVGGSMLDVLGEQASEQRPFLVWGAGAAGEKVIDFLTTNNLPIAGVLDSNLAIEGTEVRSLPVRHPDAALAPELHGQKPFVLIASMYAREIAEALEQRGYTFKQDYLG